MRDDRPYIEPGLDHYRHLVPSLENLAPAPGFGAPSRVAVARRLPARLRPVATGNVRFEGYEILIGADAMVASALVVGAQLSVSQRDGEFADGVGGVERTAALLTTYLAKNVGESFSLEGALSAGLVDLDHFERRASLGDVASASARGDTEGVFWGARLGGRYGASFGRWGLETGMGLSVDRLNLDAFDETPSVLALSYGDVELESLRGDVHVTLRYGGPDDMFSPHVSVRHQHNFQDDDLALDIGPNRATRATWRTERAGQSATAVELGVHYRISPGTHLRSAITLDQTDQGDETTALRVAFSSAF